MFYENKKQETTEIEDAEDPMMAPKQAASSKPSQDRIKCERKMLTIQEKVRLLAMIKDGKKIVEVARHFSLNESTVRYIRKEEKKIRATASITFNKEAKNAPSTFQRLMDEFFVGLDEGLSMMIGSSIDDLIVFSKNQEWCWIPSDRSVKRKREFWLKILAGK
ncbi:hypothetical protein AAG570_008128 [Ranatra chinensis]|uniref:HTH psq-type domain-containing protein n=1 Tax=Ranatra chinensis TaxID=642074 RepID=A0ABD0YHQ5_9HEMI